mgnify:CR=1 FL=1
MGQKWVWQQANWPNWSFDQTQVTPCLLGAVRAVSPLITLANQLSPEKRLAFESQVLLDETLSTSQIEQQVLDRDSVRSSIARHLGLPNAKLVEKRWQAQLFIETPRLKEITLGDYRDEAMTVVSGHFGRKDVVHFQAPCEHRACVEAYMEQFIDWFNQDQADADYPVYDYLKAAIAKFWFVTIHPFDDGNGRLSRILAERCLAQADDTDIRLYSISSEMARQKSDYYHLLEKMQKGEGDLTEWILWFLNCVRAAAQTSLNRLEKVGYATQFWDQHRAKSFNERQRKLLLRFLETDDFDDGIAKRKYKNLVATSDATAARDLTELVELGVLQIQGKGRSVKYFLS